MKASRRRDALRSRANPESLSPSSTVPASHDRDATPASLADVLAGETALYEKLLGVLRDEEHALLENDGRAVADGLARKESLILEIRLAELSRQALVARVTGRSDTRLRDLPPDASRDLTAARTRLLSVLPEIERVNHRVAALLQRSLGRLRSALELIRDAAGIDRHYTADAREVSGLLRAVDGRA
jgi:flagellar biosynthesis/type III secretory pathway chaperone